MLEFAKEIASRAGEIILGYYERLDEAQISTKSTYRDLVTAADLESERYLLERIRARYPDHAIYAEETLHEPTAQGPCWYLDPLDGTVNFVHSLPLFGVSIGFYDGPEPLLGVVHLPRLGELFWATKGGGCWKDGERVQVSRVARLENALVGTGFPYKRSTLKHNNLANFDRVFAVAAGVRRMGSACADLAYLACGRLDAFWELHLEPHDIAAGAVLVREAGGVVTDVAGGQDWLHGRNVVCAPPAVHEHLRSLVEFEPE